MADRFRWTLTLQSSRHDILIQVVHVIRHDEVLRCSSPAHVARIEIEGWGQRRKAGVVDNSKTCEDLYLLPAMEPLSQSSGDLTQGLPTKDYQKVEEEMLLRPVFKNMMRSNIQIPVLLCCQYFVVHIIQGRAVSHVESPKESVSLFLYLLCLWKHMTKYFSQLCWH